MSARQVESVSNGASPLPCALRPSVPAVEPSDAQQAEPPQQPPEFSSRPFASQ
jgi:hypothetical protein